MCECRKDIEEKLLARFIEKSPSASNHEVSLKGYAIVIGETLSSRPFMPATLMADHPLKKGGLKRKTEEIKMLFTYCPFCGTKQA